MAKEKKEQPVAFPEKADQKPAQSQSVNQADGTAADRPRGETQAQGAQFNKGLADDTGSGGSKNESTDKDVAKKSASRIDPSSPTKSTEGGTTSMPQNPTMDSAGEIGEPTGKGNIQMKDQDTNKTNQQSNQANQQNKQGSQQTQGSNQSSNQGSNQGDQNRQQNMSGRSDRQDAQSQGQDHKQGQQSGSSQGSSQSNQGSQSGSDRSAQQSGSQSGSQSGQNQGQQSGQKQGAGKEDSSDQGNKQGDRKTA